MDFSKGQRGERCTVLVPETPFQPVLQLGLAPFPYKKTTIFPRGKLHFKGRLVAVIKVKRTSNDNLVYETKI